MNKCDCGSYAINIDVKRIVCDVCYWRLKADAAEAKLEAVKGLIPGWKGEDFGLSDYIRGEINGRNECAEEFEALLEKLK